MSSEVTHLLQLKRPPTVHVTASPTRQRTAFHAMGCGDLTWRLFVLHGIIMTFMYGVVVFSGILFARFGGKAFSSFHVNLMAEVASGPTLIGMALAFTVLDTHLNSTHARLGVAIVVASVFQGWLGATMKLLRSEREPLPTKQGKKVKRGSDAHRRIATQRGSLIARSTRCWSLYTRCILLIPRRREWQLRLYHRLQGYGIFIAATYQIHLGLSRIGAKPVFFYAYYAFLCVCALTFVGLQRWQWRSTKRRDAGEPTPAATAADVATTTRNENELVMRESKLKMTSSV